MKLCISKRQPSILLTFINETVVLLCSPKLMSRDCMNLPSFSPPRSVVLPYVVPVGASLFLIFLKFGIVSCNGLEGVIQKILLGVGPLQI